MLIQKIYKQNFAATCQINSTTYCWVTANCK